MRRAGSYLAAAAAVAGLLTATTAGAASEHAPSGGVIAPAATGLPLAALAGLLLAGWLRGWGSRAALILVVAVFGLDLGLSFADAAPTAAWWWAHVVAAGLGVPAGVLALIGRPAPTRASAADPGSPDLDSLATWRALDAGIDPTAESGSGGVSPGGPEWDDPEPKEP